MGTKRQRSVLEVAKRKTVERLKKNGSVFDSLVELGYLTPNGKITKSGISALENKPEVKDAA